MKDLTVAKGERFIMKNNLFIIHGYNGDTKETFGPYIENEMAKLNVETYFPNFPIRENVSYESWAKVMDMYLEKGLINENTIIIAHSLGTNFVPKYLADNNIKIFLYISMAGFLKDNSGREDIEAAVSKVRPSEEQIQTAIKLMKNRYAVYSNNDHLNPKEELEKYAEKFMAEKVFIPNVGHMGRKSGVKEIPEIIEIIRRFQMKPIVVKNIIFDLGNVIIELNKNEIIKKFTSNEQEMEILKENIFDGPEWKLLDKGQMSNNEAIDSINKRLPNQLHKTVQIFMKEWYKHQKINEDTVEIAKKLKQKGYKIFVLSNMAAETFEYIKGHKFFCLCDGIVISSYEKMVKPEEKIFTTLLDRYKIDPEETLFIDDDDTNKSIYTANKIGILGRKVLPNNSEDVLKLLNEFEVKI